MCKSWCKNICNNPFLGCVVIFFAALAAAVLLLLLVTLIPTDAISSNVASSAIVLEQEGEYVLSYFGNKPVEWDNFTSNLMLRLSCASYSLENIMLGNSAPTLHDALNPSTQLGSYPQYWFGWLIVLKPLLVLFDISQIRCIFLALASLLVLGISISLSKQKHILFAIVLVLAFVFIDGIYAVQNLSLAFSFFIALAACFWVCKYKEKHGVLFSSKSFIYLLFLTGISTAFFDFLCTPLLTLTLPLATAIILDKKHLMSARISFTLLRFVLLCVIWAAGYLFFWASKWLIVMLFFDPNFFTDLQKNIGIRTSGNEEYPLSRKAAVLENLKTAFSKKFLICTVIAAILFCIWGFKRREKNIRILVPIILLVALALSPIIWNCFVAANHSQIHAFFTYRTHMITMVAAPWALLSLVHWQQK